MTNPTATGSAGTPKSDDQVVKSLYAKAEKIYPREVHHLCMLQLCKLVPVRALQVVFRMLSMPRHLTAIEELYVKLRGKDAGFVGHCLCPGPSRPSRSPRRVARRRPVSRSLQLSPVPSRWHPAKRPRRSRPW